MDRASSLNRSIGSDKEKKTVLLHKPSSTTEMYKPEIIYSVIDSSTEHVSSDHAQSQREKMFDNEDEDENMDFVFTPEVKKKTLIAILV